MVVKYYLTCCHDTVHLLGYLREVVPEEATRMGEHVFPVERVKVREGFEVLLPVFSPALHFTHGCQYKINKLKYTFQ